MASIFDSTSIEQGRTPDIWDELTDGTTYMGYALPGTLATSEARFLIVKISTSGTVSRREYANGSKQYNNVWDNRAGLNYTFFK